MSNSIDFDIADMTLRVEAALNDFYREWGYKPDSISVNWLDRPQDGGPDAKPWARVHIPTI